MKDTATSKDITKEAKEVLSFAMKGFCKSQRVKTEREAWIEDRTMQIRIHDGLDESDAKKQAEQEYELQL